MPQIFPMNWILLTMLMLLMMITMIVIFYFFNIKKMKMHKNIIKPYMYILSIKW
uniref:ATP synthase subunit 8 n=1 Tax=Amblyomma albolimbatum TaxID=1987572 RepID=UPI0030FE317B